MKRLAALVFAFGLAGCNAEADGGLDVRAQVSPDFSASMQRYGSDLKLARQHRMTYVAAAQRLRQGAMSTPGAALSDADSLLIAFIVAMSAEVDAGRMTPEMLVFKIQERAQQNNAAQQRAVATNRLQALQTLRAMQDLQHASNPAPLLDPPPFQMPLVAAPSTRLQMNCTSTQMGIYTNTNCN